jgi:hypothetical protein
MGPSFVMTPRWGVPQGERPCSRKDAHFFCSLFRSASRQRLRRPADAARFATTVAFGCL